ncbi:hypothetical protein TVAG_042030 [Trichomonas vaginalis G3]|uniref:BEACH domain-containing protein n=1 Tax=Trichomonas vaginalis (strain ATCC PRA-98 / G3) TaxID=412133 RepID=A2EUU2_TRIV3|nr:platelet formation protein family [Trichomonas vaginalis G3]EAY03551.1 hypothetical protein TVAG_042030 [Trichomonas vaginalis G3]KAI5550052.1 platelet formation protein family [Trichomonas vaginalis G3]|eukprot:XP_001315774.1 hypothetical protein [Trichomonas vaginalis G3]
MFEQYKEKIDDLFVLIYMNFEEFSNEMHFLEELFVTKMVNHLYETKDTELFKLYNTIFEKVIFFHANMISPILYYENSIFEQTDKILIINSEFDIYKFSKCLMKTKEHHFTFGLKFDAKGDWIDANIALSILCLSEKTKILVNPVFDFMIFSFLNRIEYIDQKQHFSQLNGVVVNHPILKQALQFAQYSHAMKNKIEHNLIQNPFLDENESKELIESITPFEFMNKLTQKQKEYNSKNINTTIKLNKDVTEMLMKVERKMNKMRTKYHFYEDYGNQSWILLWKQLYSERGPWYNSSSDHQIMKTIRENCFCFVPVKICNEENYFNMFETANEGYKPLFGCDCSIVTIRETFEMKFEITETNIVFDKKYLIEISSISKIFFRKNNSLELLLKSKEMILIRFKEVENKDVAKKIYEINHLISIEEIDLNQIKRWKKNLISNFELISYLNSFEGNSYNDIENYPIFPDINSHYVNVVYSKQYVKEILSKIEENKKINFDVKSFCIPEEYCMPLVYEDIHILSQRHVELESEDNIDFVVEWINKNFSSVLETSLTKREQKEREIVQLDGIISNDAVVSSFIDSRSKMFTILSQNKIFFGNYTLSGEANLTETKQIKLPPYDKVYFVNLSTIVLILNSPAMFSIYDLMTDIFIVESKISEIGEITNVSYTENYISFCSENASNMIYKDYLPYFTVHLFKESVVCSAVSNTFQSIVSAMCDRSLIITKLQNGSLQKVIHLKNMQCRLLTITPSLGVIVSYCTKVSGGRLLHYILSHDINGNYIGEKEIHGKITIMSSFSYKGIELVILCKGVRFIIINALTLQTLMSTSAGEQISSISFDTRYSVLSMVTNQCTIKSLKINIENELLLM